VPRLVDEISRAFQLEQHLVTVGGVTKKRWMSVCLRTAVDQRVGVDERQILTLSLGERCRRFAARFIVVLEGGGR
jgi:hypothetical protein